MIHFYDELVSKTLQSIKESYDFADVLNDLNRINQAIAKPINTAVSAAAVPVNSSQAKHCPAKRFQTLPPLSKILCATAVSPPKQPPCIWKT